MSDRICKVVRGTTHAGRALNEGEEVLLPEDVFRKLSMTQDVVEIMPTAKPEPVQKSTAQPIKKTA
jgi:hypothetical protein